jgi:Polyketide cyclase / dehydrase and lipid transport
LQFDTTNHQESVAALGGDMLTLLALVVLVTLTAGLIFAATRPNSFRVERSVQIEVAPEVVFSNINDFNKWTAWSPWENIDPALKRQYSGAAKGKGAVYSWVGNGQVGSGRMQIVESVPFTAIQINIDFTAPFTASNVIDFSLTKRGDITEVNWAMSGPQPFLSKLMGLVFNMDKVVGSQFATGLAQLKLISEGTGYTRLMR